MPDLVEFADDSVALAMKKIFSQSHIYDLDIADRLKQLLYEKKYDLNSPLQSDAASVSSEILLLDHTRNRIFYFYYDR